MLGYYILADDGVTPVPIADEDWMIWAEWYEEAYRKRSLIVQQDYAEGTERVGVSTVFLAVNHRFGPGPPILWESLVFGTSLDGEMNRYASHEAARRGHNQLLTEVRAAYEAERLKEAGE